MSIDKKTGMIRLEELSPEKLADIDAWKIVNNIEEEEEILTPNLLEAYESLIAPAEKDENRLVLPTNGQVWCLVNAVFANGKKHIGISLCEADSDVGPICWSLWNG